MSFRRKILLTLIYLALFAALGVSYQFYYLEEREEFERSIQNYYVKQYGSQLEETKLKHLAVLAMDRFGITELFRNEDDYRQLLKEEAN